LAALLLIVVPGPSASFAAPARGRYAALQGQIKKFLQALPKSSKQATGRASRIPWAAYARNGRHTHEASFQPIDAKQAPKDLKLERPEGRNRFQRLLPVTILRTTNSPETCGPRRYRPVICRRKGRANPVPSVGGARKMDEARRVEKKIGCPV